MEPPWALRVGPCLLLLHPGSSANRLLRAPGLFFFFLGGGVRGVEVFFFFLGGGGGGGGGGEVFEGFRALGLEGLGFRVSGFRVSGKRVEIWGFGCQV